MTRSVLSDTTLTHEEMCGEDVTIQDLTHRSFLKKNHHCGYSVGINLHNFLSYRGLSFLVFIAMLPLARYAPETSALQVRPLSPEQGALLRGAATSSITKAQDTEKVISLTAHPIAEPVRLLPIVAPALESNALLDPEVFDEDSSNAMPVKVDSNFIQAVRDEEDDDAKDLKRPPIIDEIEEQEAQEEQEHYGLDIDESQNDIMLQPIEETPI